jgi:methylenetetrahydrofolate reductase (NADPH)
MRIDLLIDSKPRTISFEFFPPKNDRDWNTLEDTIDQLAPLGPDFVSVTYGAGGSTRAKTREVVEHIQGKTGLTAMAHLTCVNATKSDIKALLDEYAGAGIQNLLALRGDPPKGQSRFTPTDGGCSYAVDLLDMIRKDGRFAALCAAFPERHPDASSRESDWQFLQKKFEAGACAAITQAFFEPQPYKDMVAHLTKALSRKPRVIPGIYPITGLTALEKFCTFCNATIPKALRDYMAPYAGDKIGGRKAGIAYTVQFCRDLLAAGAPGLHIYCFNRSTAAAELITGLRLLKALD